MKSKLIILLGFVLCFLACEKALVPEDAANNPREVFDALWTFTDEYYCYFDYKGVDWDSVRTVYEPRVDDNMNDLALFDLLAEMLILLEDGHTNLTSASPTRFSFYDNAYLYPANFNFNTIANYYLIQGDEPTWPSYSGFQVAMLSDDILYIRYSSFGNPVFPLTNILNDFPNSKGMILDVRNNGGGNYDADMAGYFTTTDKLVAYYTQKDGPAHDAFIDLLPVTIKPAEVFYNQKVVVLTNRGCYSATSNFVQYMKEFDDVVQLGDTTGGGAGTPLGYELPNGWTVRVSFSPYFGVDGFNFEEGTPPDIVAMDDPTTPEVDEIIERALEEF